MTTEELTEFKVCCAYQLEHNPDLTLHPAFRRIMNQKTLTYGVAATIAPFIVASASAVALDETK